MKLRSALYSALLGLSLLSAPAFAQDAGGGAAAAAPAAAATSAPAATTSAPAVSTSTAAPAAESSTSSASSADASTSAVDPSAPSGGLTPNPGEGDAAFLARVMAAKGGLEADPSEEDDETDDTSTETPAGENKGTEEKPEDKGAEGTGEGEDDYDPYAPPASHLAPKELSAKIDADPALKAALDANPALRQELFEQSRLAAESAAFREVFTSAEEAKVAAQGNAEFTQLTDLVTSINEAKDAQGFYAKLLELSVLHDDDGNPIMQDGKPVSDNTVGKLIHHTFDLALNHWAGVADGGDDDELTAAVEVLRDRAFGKKSTATNEGLTQEQQTREQALTAREQAIAEKERTSATTKAQEFETSIETGIDAHADSELGRLLGRTDIAEADRGPLAEKIRAAAYELIVENPVFKREQDMLMKRQAGEKTRQARIGLGKKWLATALPLVAPKLIAEAGAKIIARQGKATAAQAARVEASRSEGAGTLGSAKPAQTGSAKGDLDLATENFKSRVGRAPNSGEIFDELIRLRTAK